MKNARKGLIVSGLFCFNIDLAVLPSGDCDGKVVAQIRLDPGHPWRPPFGLDRVGRPVSAVVEIASQERPAREYWLAAYVDGKETDRRILDLTASKAPFISKTTFDTFPNELVLFARCRSQGKPVELARLPLQMPQFEAEAIARPGTVINPVDLGAVLVPSDWLLLAGNQATSVDVAAISQTSDIPDVRLTAWFESRPQGKVAANIKLVKGRRMQLNMRLPAAPFRLNHDVLHVAVSDGGGKELWHKKIQTMLVANPPRWPQFGATETKLRYDAPISVRDPKTGALSSMDYTNAWAPHLKDVVVSFPNGARFVFWRGSSYVPFWAGRHNTGMTYEWAETTPPPDGYTDSVEPLMDKELRYGRVEIVESTAARVHVRWSYQSTDFNYKVWGDAAVEDFYFYPDGFGTRVLGLKSAPAAKYEVLEFIILTPPAAYPFDVLHPDMTDILFMDGEKRQVKFPAGDEKAFKFPRPGVGVPRDMPAIYRIRLHKDETDAAICFNPVDTHLPQIFSPFFDHGYMVTPAYWGSHWPLARGKTTGWAIDDRIYLSPAHNSLMTWNLERQTPLGSATIQTVDTLGQSRTMTLRRWAWLIGMSDASDRRLLEWAHSFSKPPSLELKGARLDFDAYVSERRALRLIVEDKNVTITIKPAVRCVNPAFELLGAPRTLVSAILSGRRLNSKDYAWDGQILWLNADIDQVSQLSLDFGSFSR